MAKYSITHTCGHTSEHTLFGKHSGFGGRDSKIEWLETQPCLVCVRAEESRKRDEQNAAAAEANKSAGYLPLAGSEKQIAWAETIRRECIEAMAEVFEKVPADAKSAWAQTSEWLKNQTESKWWIETVGTLKSKEGLAPLFGLIDGKQPKASKGEILRALLMLSPYLSEEIAKLLGIEQQFRDAVQARLRSEARTELESRKPIRPAFVFAGAPSGATWNGKIYSGRRIYVGQKETRMTAEQETELNNYLAAKAAWQKEMEATK